MVLVVDHTLVMVSRLPRSGAGLVDPAAPDVHHRLALDGDRHGSAQVAAPGQAGGQQVPNGREAVVAAAVNLGLVGRCWLLGGAHGATLPVARDGPGGSRRGPDRRWPGRPPTRTSARLGFHPPVERAHRRRRPSARSAGRGGCGLCPPDERRGEPGAAPRLDPPATIAPAVRSPPSSPAWPRPRASHPGPGGRPAGARRRAACDGAGAPPGSRRRGLIPSRGSGPRPVRRAAAGGPTPPACGVGTGPRVRRRAGAARRSSSPTPGADP